jgi:hypothetical protein
MSLYQEDYFVEGIFETDYTSIANLIFKTYQPKTIVEFGCGPGHLTRELDKLNIAVTAIDGFSNPDFKNARNISFSKVDLNDQKAIAQFLGDKRFDLAVCTEVGEHLNPASSEHLIKYLTQSAPVVIFSAAVPGQRGHGHINCKPRELWHDLFSNNGFRLIDSFRQKLRDNENLAVWYKLNLLDYVSKDSGLAENENVIRNLLSSESYASSMFYTKSSENLKNLAYLNYPVVKQYFQLRNFIKKLLKK